MKLLKHIVGKIAMINQTTNEEVCMTSEEKDIIKSFANGHNDLRDEAIGIHRKYIPIIGVRGSPEQDFMAEVDHPSPDAVLKEQYRVILLGNDQ